MIRSLTVVLGFVVANTLAFVAYRASAAPDAEDTISREPPPIQPKPAPPTISTTPVELEPARPDSPSPLVPIVSTGTDPEPAEPPRAAPRPAPPRPRAAPPARRPAEPVPAARPAPEAQPVEKPPTKDRLLEMEANPYKRGE